MNRREMMAGLGSTAFVACAPSAAWTRTPSPLKGYVRTNWSRDAFSFGSYSFRAAGSTDADRAALAHPIDDTVFFAGEALNPTYQSSVHAAYESGLGAAEQCLGAAKRRIAVIGAGMSGLTAARRLTEAGREVSVFEARDRIGGRIWTDRSLGVALDVGASWIHGPNGNPITKLADQAGLQRAPTDEAYIIRGGDGRQIWSIFAPGWIWDHATETSLGAAFSELNLEETQAAYEEHGLGYEGQDVIFPNGYDQIFAALSGAYEVRLSTAVKRIEHSPAGVVVHPASGPAHSFDAVIVTVPLGALKRETIAFSPSLPAAKAAAIARMGMGTLDKLYLLFEDVFWDRDVTEIMTPETGLPQGQFNSWVNYAKYLGKPILMAFNAGPQARALSADADDALVAKALRTLAAAYPS